MTDLEPPPGLPDDARRIWTQTLTQLLAAGTTAKITKQQLLEYVTARQHADDFAARWLPPAITGGEPMHGQESIHPPGTWHCETHNMWHGSCHNKDGSRCHNPHMIGLNTCRMHPGRGAKAKHLAALERRRNPLQGEPMDIGPAQALLWRVRVLAGEVARLDETVAALEAEDLVWGQVSHTEEDNTDELSTTDATATRSRKVRRTTNEARLNIWIQLRERREKELRLAAEAALHAGVEERLVRLAESQGAMVHRVLTGVFADLAAAALLTVAATDERVTAIAAARLRELTA